MKALVLGGTSFFGKDLVKLLVAAGYDVTLFTRGNVVPHDLPKHRHIKGDRKNAADLERAAKEGPWDAVVDNICFNAKEARDAIRAFEKCGRYILTSTVSVYKYVKDRNAVPYQESSVDYGYVPPEQNLNNVHWNYRFGKKEAERIVVEECRAPWTITRPPVIYGPNDVTNRGFWYLQRLKSGGPILLADGGVCGFRISYSLDIARGTLLALQSPKAEGRTYNLDQEEIVTLRGFIIDSAEIMKVKPQLINIPYDLLGEELAGPYADMVNIIPDTSLAIQELGFKHTPWLEFLNTTTQWFLKEWKGNEAALLSTRAKELEMAAWWTKVVQTRP